ncbi:hypothetical protein P171DRAFT_426669 [Karstenula rhodostoma CBS 690.94]|uniref:Uncharacterized protein n=1 Tax=Karstenula rhodostoma CBS 690.94 TaxID=1392251 RepID=A0A9P4PVS7_9PLEO|nr:hypothetical protein P171DRAFT_426669 [Karstenula rhodostoma CBS 690.94]
MDPASAHPMPQSDLISSWLLSTQNSCFLPSPPPDEAALEPFPAPPKRKRAMSLPTTTPVPSSHRSDTQKRRRIEYSDNVLPEQSASQLGSNTPLTLNEKNTFSSRSRLFSKRSSSPARETPIILRNVWPPVIAESLNGVRDAPLKHVERLSDRLPEGVDCGFIPKGLEVCDSNIVAGPRMLLCS